MNVLITGGSGFLGRWLVTRSLERGYTVTVLGRKRYPDLEARGVETIQADLLEKDKVLAAFKGIDAVFHTAAKVGIWGPRRLYRRTNVVGTRNVLDGCLTHNVRRLVFTSTPSVVFQNRSIEGGTEQLPYPQRFIAGYPESKSIAEREVIKANGRNGLLTCALRPHLVWGPGDTNLVPAIAGHAQKNRLARIGDGTNLVSVSYVENVAASHLCACERLVEDSPVPGQCYFITDAEPVNCWGFITKLLTTLDCPLPQKQVSLRKAYYAGLFFEVLYTLCRLKKDPPMTRFLALQLGTSHWFKIDKARRELEWEPQVNMEEGLKRLKESFIKGS